MTVPVPEDETSIPDAKVIEAAGPRRPHPVGRFLRKPFGAVVLVYLAALLVASVGPSVLTGQGPLDADLANVLSVPSAAHPLGTDSLGRDIWSRIVYGTRSAMIGVLMAVVVASLVAIPLGLAAAMSRRTDKVMSGVNDVVLSIPGIVVLLMVLTVSDSLNWAMAGFGLLSAPGLIRVVRSSAIVVVEEPYVAAARVFGLTQARIAVWHVLPRVLGPIIVNLSLIAGSALVAAAGLNYLGLGVRPPAPTWGGLVADGAKVIFQQPWTMIPAGATIAITVVVFVLLGDTARDVLVDTWTSRPRVPRRQPGAAHDEQSAVDRSALRPVDPDAVLQVDNLSVSFPAPGGGELTIVDSVSFTLGRGSAIGIVGESGCGKTMTGLAVLGALPESARVSSGRVLIDGVDVLEMPVQQRRALRGTTIAFVSQEPMVALDPLFTVGDQIAEAVKTHAGLRSRTEVSARVLQLLEQVQINDPNRVRGLYPHEISGGMAQRVAIAIALAGNPKILIADEPTTALDVTVQSEIVALLNDLQHEIGLGVLLISHDWGVVSELCESAVVMYAGQVVESAALGALLEDPSHPYTHGLLDANPHYAVPGERLRAIPGSVPAPEAWPTSCRFRDRCPFAADACTRQPIKLVEASGGHQSRCIRVEALRSARRSS